METFNFSSLQQKADQVLHNADEAISKWIDLTLAPAQDIPVEYYDKNGNLVQTTVPNRAKLFNDLLVNVNSAMKRRFYLDAVNGSDSNDGSQTAPFQTLQKAMNSIPTGGHGKIIFLSDISISSEIDVSDKSVEIDEGGFTLTNNINGYFLIKNSHLKIFNGVNNIVDRNLIQINSSSFGVINLGDYSPRTSFNISGTATSIVSAYRTILVGFASGIDVVDSGTAVKVFETGNGAVVSVGEWNNTYSTNVTLT